MRRYVPAVLAGTAAVVPWISLGGPAIEFPGSRTGAPMFALRDYFHDPVRAMIAVSWFLLIPAGFALVAALRKPGPVWALAVAFWAAIPITRVTMSTHAVMTWHGRTPDGRTTGGLAQSIATAWIFPLLAGAILLGLAALTVPAHTDATKKASRGSSPADARSGQRARYSRVLVSVCGFLALLVITLPYATDVSEEPRPRMMFAPARLFSMREDDVFFWVLWLIAIVVFFMCVWFGVRPPKRTGAIVLIAVAALLAVLNVLTLVFIVGTIRLFSTMQILPSPSLVGCVLIPPLAVAAAVLLWRAAPARSDRRPR